jgi:putative membrane protein
MRLVYAVILTLVFVAPANASAPLSAHMGSHIALMNFLAPLIALAVIAFAAPRVSLPDNAMVLPATVSQIFLLWVVHAPTVLIAAMSNSVLHVGLQALLFLVALWFWIAIFLQAPRRFWRAIFALLVTGKLFCLLGALLVFAPRPLYAAHGVHTISAVIDVTGVEDQQLAGLLMLVACPLSYVVAGIAITARAIRSLDTTDEFLRPAEGLVRGDQR